MIFRHLISNAVKLTSENGRILVKAEYKNDTWVTVSVKDTGIGMSRDMADTLFQFHGNSTRQGTAGEPGNGMGLMLCHEFVERNRGKIWVESETGVGTTISFTISVADHQKENQIKTF